MTWNVFISSISKKVPLIKQVRQAMNDLGLGGKLIGGDASPDCIGRFFVDGFWQMPLLESLTIELFLENCERFGIKAIIPTRTEELTFFGLYRDILKKHGIACLISPLASLEKCLDKLTFSRLLAEWNFPGIPAWEQIDAIDTNCRSYVVKNRFGAGSREIKLNLSLQEALSYGKNIQNPLFQPFIEGEEYSVDLYVDQTKKVKGVLARRRELVIGGESQVTYSEPIGPLEELCSSLAEKLELYGPAVIQVIRGSEGLWNIIECNPRFGGASTLGIVMGVNSFVWFLLEALDLSLPPFIRERQEKRQVRHPEDWVTDK